MLTPISMFWVEAFTAENPADAIAGENYKHISI